MFKPLFNQESPIEIKNFLFNGVLNAKREELLMKGQILMNFPETGFYEMYHV